MRVFDPIAEFDEVAREVETFLAGHRLDPYTMEEIEALRTPPPKPLTLGVNETVRIAGFNVVVSGLVPEGSAIAFTKDNDGHIKSAAAIKNIDGEKKA